MSIKVKIIILAIFSLVVTTTIGLILFQNNLTVKKEIEKQVIISATRTTLLEQSVLRDEYFLYREERSIVQLQILSESLEKLYLQLSSTITLADEKVSLKILQDNSNSVNQIFSQIVANSSTSNKELEQRLISQILIKSQEGSIVASQLISASRNRVIESQNRATIFVLVFLASSIIIVLLVIYFIWFSIAKPLIILKEAAVRIASLDFTTTTTTTTTGKNSNDEIGQLAHAFNEMVAKLKESYRKKEDTRLELVGTAEKLAVIAEEKEEIRKKLVVTNDKLIRSEKLAVLGKLAGIMGHEIRNPLGVIRNSIYFLTMKFQGSMDEKVKRHMDILENEIDGCDKIISDVLDFARTKPPSFAETEINSVVKASLSKVSIPKTVKVKTDLGENLPKLNIDRAQIQQVFSNIISNAIEAMPKGGELRVSTSQTDAFITIAFKDTGVGISKENTSKLFEPLFSTKAKGLGLGLAACQNIISGHQGKIEFESQEGQGATFAVTLPIYESTHDLTVGVSSLDRDKN